ncbi:MAG: hypothetical protein LIP01_09025, partial [Tannerellaceae bacterium]|nr:hypothetical protein [Tannerellaceae bacterium]
MIPKNIHLISLYEEVPFPAVFSRYVERIKSMRPDWTIRLYHEEDIIEILKEYAPQWLDVYNSYAYNVQKADFSRVALLYILGGFYMDMDMYCFNPLDNLLEHTLVLGEEKMMCKQERDYLNLFHPLRVANYMFGSCAGHPFWLVLIQQMIKRKAESVNSQNDILETTGPGLMTNIYHAQKHRFPDITLLRNNDRRCACDYHTEIACCFGNFAAHLHFGTWRAQVGSLESPGLRFSITHSPFDQQAVTAYKQYDISIEQLAKDSRLKMYPNLYAVYKLFEPVSRYYKEGLSRKEEDVIIYFDRVDLVSSQKKGKKNVLFIADYNYQSAIWNIDLINGGIDLCIVPESHLSEKLKQAGLKIKIEVVSPGFKFIKRLFNEPTGSKDSQFLVGMSSIGIEEQLPELITHFVKVREELIPELRVSILHGYKNKAEFIAQTSIGNSLPGWISLKSIMKDIPKW